MPAHQNVLAPYYRQVNGALTPLSISATNLAAVYSVIRVNNWNRNCLQVRRSLDNATLDIGFNGNVADWITADQFAMGSQLFVTKWHDQSGNGVDVSQATTALQPGFFRAAHWNGIRPISFLGLPSSALTSSYLSTTALSIAGNNCTYYMMACPRDTGTKNAIFGAQSGATEEHDIGWGNGNPQVFSTVPGHSATQSTIVALSKLQAYGLSSGPSAGSSFIGVGNTVAARGNDPTSGPTITNLQIGAAFTAGYPFYGDIFYFAIYTNQADSSATMTSALAYLTAAFVAPKPVTKRLVYNGSSLTTSHFANPLNYPNANLHWITGFGRQSFDDNVGGLPAQAQQSWDVVAPGLFGRQLVTGSTAENTGTWFTSAVDGTKSENVYLIDAPSNDIANATYASASDAQTGTATTLTTNAATPSGNVLHFVSGTTANMIGGFISDTTKPSAIPANTYVTGQTPTTLTLSANVTGAGVGNADTISVIGTLCAQSLYNSMLSYINTLKGAGYHIVVPTTIPRGGFDTTTNWRESARLYYNNLVTSNAAVDGYAASDRCSVYPFNGQTFDQTYYWTDNTHCLQRGLWTFGQVDLAAILSA